MPAQENIIIKIVKTNERLSKWFEREFPNCEYSSFCAMVRKKDIKVNERRINKDLMLNANDKVEIFCSPLILNGKQEKIKKNIEIVFEDENIIIINKPANVEVEGENSISSILSERFKANIYPVHRLDRNTQGLLIFAKSETILNELIYATKNNEIEKHYLTWVNGNFPKKQTLEKAFLFKDSKKALSLISKDKKAGYIPIATQINLIKSEQDKSLLEVIIHNGKTHQIRAHLAFLGYPIIGDGKYNFNQRKDKLLKINANNNNKVFKHQLLLAYKVIFNLKSNSELAYLNNCKIELNTNKFTNIFN